MDFFLQQDVSLLKEQPTENLSVEYHILTAKKKQINGRVDYAAGVISIQTWFRGSIASIVTVMNNCNPLQRCNLQTFHSHTGPSISLKHLCLLCFLLWQPLGNMLEHNNL